MARRLRYYMTLLFIVFGLVYVVVYVAVVQHAYQFSNQTEPKHISNPTAVVLGNRAKVKGVPNICMTGRVDKALALLNQYGGQRLIVSGGVDPIEQGFEAQVMATHALSKGFSGQLIQEKKSTTTQENLQYSTPLLHAIGATTVIVVSEPHHIWRASLLAHAQGMTKQFDMHFVAAKTECWEMQGIFSTGAVREPLAIIKNYMQGNY
jgi:uncharacterized SAM-binding protein YcdF (DUF218 family)